MNWLLVSHSEKISDDTFCVTGVKHSHIQNILQKKLGDHIKLTIENLGNFVGEIILIAKNQTNIRIKAGSEFQFNPFPISVAVALQRPQTGKKILHLSGCFGVQSLLWYSHETKSKEYFTSPVYNQAANEFLFDGMMQSGNFLTPKIELLKNKFWDYLDRETKTIYVLDREGTPLSETKEKINIGNSLFVFGPESGYTDLDFDRFQKLNVQIISLNKINLRTEFAYSILLHELSILKADSTRN